MLESSAVAFIATSAAAPSVTALPGNDLAAWLPTIVMVVGIIMLGTILMVMFHRRERQLKSIAAQIAGDLEEARTLRQQLDEAHERLAASLTLAQRLGARLDERLASLDLASLKMQATRSALPRAMAQPLPRAETAMSAAGPAPSSAGAPAPAAARTSFAPGVELETKPVTDALTQRIYALADAGRSPVNIARDLNDQVGKIELILALRKQIA